MVKITGEPIWDGVGTLSIGILLGVIATILAREMHSEGRLESVDSKMRITGERVSEVHEEIAAARNKQKDYVQLQEETRSRIT